MSFVLGVVLFALVLAISVSAHEFGHLLTAKMFGMKARRYFIGFGPKLWSFRRGETEYGIKAIPAGGFVDIAGMSHLEELHEDDEPRAFWRFAAWKRAVVMSAGSITHFLLAIAILYGMAVTAGLPKLTDDGPIEPVLSEVPACVQQIDGNRVRACTAGDPPSPARRADLRPGDRILAVGGRQITVWDDVVSYIRSHPNTDLTVVYRRAGVTRAVTVHTLQATRRAMDNELQDANGNAVVGVLGASVAPLPPATVSYGPVSAIGATGEFTGQAFDATFSALGQFPSKIPKLLDALSGKPRDQSTPVSVVGVSKLGGQAVEAGQWQSFFLLLAGFNLFVGVFNLLPLLPLDGGHLAILLYEKVRSAIARARGQADPGGIDHSRLAPVMLAVIFFVGGLSLLTIYADVVNPIANPFR